MCRKLSFASDPFQETQNKANKTEKLCRPYWVNGGKDIPASDRYSNFCNMMIQNTRINRKMWKMGYSGVQAVKTVIRGGIHLHSLLLLSNDAREAQSTVCEVGKEIWITSEFHSIPRSTKFTIVSLFLHSAYAIRLHYSRALDWSLFLKLSKTAQ